MQHSFSYLCSLNHLHWNHFCCWRGHDAVLQCGWTVNKMPIFLCDHPGSGLISDQSPTLHVPSPLLLMHICFSLPLPVCAALSSSILPAPVLSCQDICKWFTCLFTPLAPVLRLELCAHIPINRINMCWGGGGFVGVVFAIWHLRSRSTPFMWAVLGSRLQSAAWAWPESKPETHWIIVTTKHAFVVMTHHL